MTISESSMAEDLARRIRVQLGEFNDDDLGVTELVRNLAEFKRAALAHNTQGVMGDMVNLRDEAGAGTDYERRR